jgi:serine/threonine protein kinase
MFPFEVQTFQPSNRTVILGTMYASGAFANVLCVTGLDGTEYVLKRIPVRSKQDSAIVESEISVLGMLSNVSLNVPKLVDYMFDEDTSSFLILMTRMPGIPVDALMRSESFSFSDTLSIAGLVLDSLAPACKILDTICCHRDLNSKNILIAVSLSGESQLSIVDFGFAVEMNAWWHYRWRDSPVAGDARYWPCCAWRMLISGWRDLKGEDQYREKLDMHSFAITLLEIVFRHLKQAPSPETEDLRLAFLAYWNDACSFADIFVSCCRTGGDVETMRSSLQALSVVGRTRENLRSIKAALKTLRESYRLFAIIERMLCIDESTVTGTWSYVCSKSVRVHY